MSRADRRAYNKKHGKKLTRQEFDSLLAMARINVGNFNLQDLSVGHDFIHMDNTELVPEGTVCKLNYDSIINRPAQQNDDFKLWIEKNKDKEFHITRDGVTNSLVAFIEDERWAITESGDRQLLPKWLFDVYSDLLFKDKNGEYKLLASIEDELINENSSKE